MNLIYGLIVGSLLMLGGQFTVPQHTGAIGGGGGCGSVPYSDSFPGSTLSACWTQTTATGSTFVNVIASGGSAVATGGGEAMAIVTGVSFPSNFYSQGALTYSGGGFSGIALSTVSGNGYLYIASNNEIVGITNGVATGAVVTGCTPLVSGHQVRLAWNNSATSLTVTDQTLGGTSLCTVSSLSNIPGMLPAIFLDGPVGTDQIATYTAD